ncbi:putative ATPase [Myoviridae environmental samples]|nr:putative ATPase [Myoviridae environmental samples]
MQHQFKAGDLALIVGANLLEQNIGRQCELVQLVIDGEIYDAPDGKRYQHGDVTCWVVTGEGICSWYEDGGIHQSDWGVCEPRHLMPLKGDQSPAQTNTETPKEVVHG